MRLMEKNSETLELVFYYASRKPFVFAVPVTETVQLVPLSIEGTALNANDRAPLIKKNDHSRKNSRKYRDFRARKTEVCPVFDRKLGGMPSQNS